MTRPVGMTRRNGDTTSARMARAVPAVSTVCVLATLGAVLSLVVRGAPLQDVFDLWVLQNAPVALVVVVVFGLALRSQPGNRAAWLFYGGGVASSAHVTSMALAHAQSDRFPEAWAALRAGTIPLRDVPAALIMPVWIASSIWLIAAGLSFLGLLYFPDGRTPSRRWRLVAWLGVGGLALAVSSYAWGYRPWSAQSTAFNALPLDDAVSRTLFLTGMPALGAGMLLAITSLAVRMRAADEQERRAVRAVVVTGSLCVAVMVLLYPWQALWAVATVPAIMLFLVTVASSVTRYRLFDVQIAVSRAVAVAGLGVAVTLTYIGTVAGLGWLLGTDSNLWLSVVATAVIAVGFDPLRRRLLSGATRLVLGAQATPYEVLSELSHRLARSDSTEEILDRVLRVLVDATGATRAEVRSRLGGGVRVDAAAGEELTDPAVRSAPVVNGGELLGEVRLLAPREDRFLPSDERLLHQVAASLGPVLRNVRLTHALHEHIEELSASRRRIVTAHDEARRKLERDIHDGAQQQLLSLRIKLGLAATIAEQAGAERIVEVIEGVAADADAAIRELRGLARGLYPPVLAEQGLEAALRAQARNLPLSTTIEARGIGRYDRGVESTVYFCCLEAMQNASKHAGASSLRIDLADGDGAVRFAVTDDGSGFDPKAAGIGAGLRNMLDRIEGLGGALEIESSPGCGAVVRGVVPAATA